MENWQIYVDENLRENVLKHQKPMRYGHLFGGRLPKPLKEPTAQDLIDAVHEEARAVEEWKAELDDGFDEDGFEVRI